MSDYLTYYLESNVVCFIIFAIILIRDRLSLDKQERTIKYDHALIAFMAYFVTDIIWAAALDGAIPRTRVMVVIINFLLFILMALITFSWLRYVMAVEHVPNREKPAKKIMIILPFVISSIALVITYFAAPSVLVSKDLELQIGYTIFLVAVPLIYIVATMVYSIRKALVAKTAAGKSAHYYIGLFPVALSVAGLFQMFVAPRTPIFCFAATIMMLLFYIKSMERQISVDPLTGLNNRGQLMRYIGQESNVKRSGKKTFVVMIDVNDFKLINDTFGHSEGDNALKIIADSLQKVVKTSSIPAFLGRYGGDEFILVIHPEKEEELGELVKKIREEIDSQCISKGTSYGISVGAGYDEYLGGNDSIQKCIQRADYKLYLDKEYSKLHSQSGKPMV